MDKKTKLSLLILIVAGFLLRTWKVNTLAFPPDGDEIAFGYYGWSLLKFGTDEYGNTLPLSFSSIGDLKYPGLAYLNIIPALFFGLSDITARFWSIISGVALIPLIYFLCFYLTKNKKASIFAAAFATFSPWSLIESRIGYENHVSFVLTLVGILTFLYYLDESKKWVLLNKKWLIWISSTFLLIATFTYAAQRLFVPAIILTIFAYSNKDKYFKPHAKKIILVFILITGVNLLATINPNYRGRAGEEAWRLTKGDEEKMFENYHSAGISQIRIHPRITWALHNKYTYYAKGFSERYLDHFSPSFLFFEGEASDENIPGMGVLIFAEILFLPIGIFFFHKKGDPKRLLLLFWLLMSPIPSALTKGGAHINRASLMIVPLTIYSGYGLFALLERKNYRLKKFMMTISVAILTWSIFYTLHQYFIVKPVLRPWYKQQVNKELTQKVLNYKDSYQAVVVTDDDYIFYLFYGAITPQEFAKNSDILPPSESKWERVKKLENIYFKMPYKCPLSGKAGVLYVCEGDEIPQNSKLIDIVYYYDRLPAYTFVEYIPISEMSNPLPPIPERLHYMVDTEKEDGFPDGIIPATHEGYW